MAQVPSPAPPMVDLRKVLVTAGVITLLAGMAGMVAWMTPRAAAREVKAACTSLEASPTNPALGNLPREAPDFAVTTHDGKTVRLSIGPHGRWTPDKARDEARELLRQMDKGIDPRAIAKKEAAQRVTLRFRFFAEDFAAVFPSGVSTSPSCSSWIARSIDGATAESRNPSFTSSVMRSCRRASSR